MITREVPSGTSLCPPHFIFRHDIVMYKPSRQLYLLFVEVGNAT